MKNLDLFNYLEPIHITDWKEFKNKFWFVNRGSQQIGYIAHCANGKYSYSDLTKKIRERKRVWLKATCPDTAFIETKELLS